MSLDEQFKTAEEAVKTLTKRPTDEELLELYALFKQATIGDCNTQKPGMFDLKGKAKWQSWNDKKGLSKEDAKKAYVEWVNNLMEKYK
ncbi:PREDICTED: acyl-CoA-binding protein homolog [Polistes dominula]|uniref:Acyl-CoA-binding protein homolog n=1 Tax=Polistes dominula TaxID=743375 RepID=A0ABM1HX76_POLDO|nr:PREDICTED: acyl-CoA-binding protein homolog [Polistes dominula]